MIYIGTVPQVVNRKNLLHMSKSSCPSEFMQFVLMRSDYYVQLAMADHVFKKL